VADTLNELADWLESAGIGEAEERYTQLFDMKPVCTLNLGHHIFGDTYARGALLAGLAGELNRHEIAHRFDLPDFLPTMLRLLAAMQDEEDRQLLVHSVMLPALKKVATALEESPGPWPQLLRHLPRVLKRLVPKGSAELPKLQRPLEVLSC